MVQGMESDREMRQGDRDRKEGYGEREGDREEEKEEKKKV